MSLQLTLGDGRVSEGFWQRVPSRAALNRRLRWRLMNGRSGGRLVYERNHEWLASLLCTCFAEKDGLERDLQIASKVHEANRELRRNVLVHLLLVELVQVVGEMLLELVHGLLNLDSLLLHDIRILEVLKLHLADLVEELHVLAQLQADQIGQGEEGLVVLLAHE